MPVMEESEYGHPDPATVATPVTEPPVEAPASGMSDSHPGASEEASEAEEPLPEFDPRWQESFEGLLYLGALTKTFDYLGHRFTIKTLSTGEILAVGQLTSNYAGTMADNRAYAMATVAACTVGIDGAPLPIPFEKMSAEAALQQRFERVKDWYPNTIDMIFNEYLMLGAKVEEVLSKMGEAFG